MTPKQQNNLDISQDGSNSAEGIGNDSCVFINPKMNEDAMVDIAREPKNSSLIEALSYNPDQYEDTMIVHINREIDQNYLNQQSKQKEGFEILEINNTDPSQLDDSEQNVMKTPVK